MCGENVLSVGVHNVNLVLAGNDRPNRAIPESWGFKITSKLPPNGEISFVFATPTPEGTISDGSEVPNNGRYKAI